MNPHQLARCLLLFSTIAVAGCKLAEFSPTLLLPEEPRVQRSVAGDQILDWRSGSAHEEEELLSVYYAIELTEGEDKQRWWLRIVPAAAPDPDDEPKEEDASKAKDRAKFRDGALKGLLSEFEGHRDRFLEEQEADPNVDETWDQIDRDTRVWLFVDTCQDSPDATWERSEVQSIAREIFAADPIAATRAASHLHEHTVDQLTRAARKQSLMSVVRGKQKVMKALFVALRSEPLKFVVEHVVERPGAGAIALAIGRYAVTSKASIGEWVTESAGVRLGERPVPAEFRAATGFDLTTVQFHPRLATTHMLRSEIIMGSTEQLPFLTGGLVAMDAMNPYDAEKRFQIRLLGWSKDRPVVEVPHEPDSADDAE